MSENKSNVLKNILEKKENINITKELLSKILKLNIKEIKFEKNLKLDNISDYEFSMLRLNATVEKDEEIDDVKVYAKVIRYDRIKESIFCYWSLIYDEQLNSKLDIEYDERLKSKSNIEMTSITKKVSIEELELEEEHKKSVFLEIKNNNFGILEYGTEIHFLEFTDYIKTYSNDINNLSRWNDLLSLDDKEILLISVVYSEKIHR